MRVLSGYPVLDIQFVTFVLYVADIYYRCKNSHHLLFRHNRKNNTEVGSNQRSPSLSNCTGTPGTNVSIPQVQGA